MNLYIFLNTFDLAWSLTTVGAVHRGALVSPAPAQPTHRSQCQCGFSFASRWLKLCSSSEPFHSTVLWMDKWWSAADTSALAHISCSSTKHDSVTVSRLIISHTFVAAPCTRVACWCFVTTRRSPLYSRDFPLFYQLLCVFSPGYRYQCYLVFIWINE